MSQNHRNWLFSRPIDLGILLLPVWGVWLACFLLSEQTIQAEIPLWVWLVFILGIDVSHVWSTIFRTYLDREEFAHHKQTLLLAPLLCFSACFVLAGWSLDWFWRILAYVALFHFIKQQYGFLALYKVRAGQFLQKRVFGDKWVIYTSMLYPVLYWHLTDERAFSWFVQGDFFNLQMLIPDFSFGPLFFQVCNGLYFLMLLGWLTEELWAVRKQKARFHWGKTLWLLTTAGNWYLGIVYFNSDLAFTLTNVVAHGIPYLALIFFYTERKKQIKQVKKLETGIVFLHILGMLAVVLFLAFGEEYLWDMLLFRERSGFFSSIVPYVLPTLEHPLTQALAFALLALPQTTHYFLDGFIWRNNAKNPYLKQIFSRR